MSREGSIVFSPLRVGSMLLPNRFMRSATWEMLSDEEGNPTDKLADMMEELAVADVGLIVPGASAFMKAGNGCPGQNGLYTFEQARLWKRCISRVHTHKSKVIFQIFHSALFSNTKYNGGIPPIGPTAFTKDQHELTNAEIEDLIQKFVDSAQYAQFAGAEGIQIHAAHGYLFSEFMSPALNHRTDKWGGSDENRLRIVNEVIEEVRKHFKPEEFSISMKLNCNDYLEGGITPEHAAKYVNMLNGKIDMFELSCGTNLKYSIRTKPNEKLLLRGTKPENKENLLKILRETTNGVKYQDMFNREACKIIRKKNPAAILALVGGIRKYSDMEDIINSGDADIISMSRPFLNDPYLIKRFYANTIDRVLCTSCSSCILSNERGNYCHFRRD